MENFITVICPTFNEVKYIENLLLFFTSVEPAEKELIIIDGGSKDGTVGIVQKWQKIYPNIKLFNNQNKYVSFALNLAIKKSKGDPIIRLDAHTDYAPDYFLKILESFRNTESDIVGGAMNKIGKTDFQKAVAVATTTTFGIGDSKIHKTGYSGTSDHVYLGAWKRKIFSEIGYFDEELVRNQDDEFHYRAKSKLKKIYLNTEIKAYYYPRESMKDLFKQYFQYGYYKPLVLKKVKSEIKIRHIIPSVFVIYILCLLFVDFYFFWILPLLSYIFYMVVAIAKSDITMKQQLSSLLIYPAIHIGYGLGFILGITKIFQKKRKISNGIN